MSVTLHVAHQSSFIRAGISVDTLQEVFDAMLLAPLAEMDFEQLLIAIEEAHATLCDMSTVDAPFLAHYRAALQCILYLASVDTYETEDLEVYTETLGRNVEAVNEKMNDLHRPVYGVKVSILKEHYRAFKQTVANRVPQMEG
jgi:hypothetical protein